MRYILLILLAFVTTYASAQVQYLGSPTTTVRNRGNFVSDSLFYLPKRQKLPSDTGALRYQISDSALYVWTGSAWRSTGTAGSAITGSGVAGYMPEFTTSTNLDTTRLYHSAGRFAIGSTTTTNGVFNVYSGQSYMDSTLKIGNGELIVGSTSSASRKLYVTSNSDVARFEQTASDKNMVIELLHTNPNASGTIREEGINFLSPNTTTRGRITFYPSDTFNVRNYLAFFTPSGSGTNGERMRIANDGEVLIGTTSDAGAYALQVSGSQYLSGSLSLGTTSAPLGTKRIRTAYQGGLEFEQSNGGVTASMSTYNTYDLQIENNNADIRLERISGKILLNPTSTNEVLINTSTDAGAYALQVAGSIYNTTGAVLATSSGNVGIGTASPSYKLQVIQATQGILSLFRTVDGADNPGLTIETNSSGTMLMQLYSAGTASNLQFGTNGSERMRIKSDGEVLIGTTSDAGAYALQVTGAIYNTTTITTGAPTSGSAKPWRLGEAATVSPTSPNRTIRVEIDGTVYYLHAKTTND